MASEIFNCELNTVLEKFFEAPKPETLEKSDSATQQSASGEADDKTDIENDGEAVRLVEKLDPDKDLEDILDQEDLQREDNEDSSQSEQKTESAD